LLVVHCPEASDGDGETGNPDDLPLWCRPPDACKLAERRLRADLAAFGREGDAVIVASGDPGEIICRTAEEHGCDLIVTGAARAESFWTSILGTTTDHLLRKARVPILVVRERARNPYGDIVVATDFSECSRRALALATHLFPDCRPVIFHAFQTPYEKLLSNPDTYREDARTAAEAKCAAFLAQARMEVDPDRVVVEHGAPAPLLRRYVRHRDIELVMIGRGGGSALEDIFVGSTARHIVDAIGCDCLILGQGPSSAVSQKGQ
jgi:nucleotide-binding universal stress UspA family protein